MSNTLQSLNRKIGGAGDLRGVVRSMKALAASSIGQYERAVESLDDYYRTVELGLAACLRQGGLVSLTEARSPRHAATVGAVVFGSDQGLVGRFNEVLADFATSKLNSLAGKKRLWAVGDRMQELMAGAGTEHAGVLSMPASIPAIRPFVGQLLVAIEAVLEKGGVQEVYVFYNHPKSGELYEPVCKRLLPLDQLWQSKLARLKWPTEKLPEVVGDVTRQLQAFVREYLFVVLFQACAESLASENASRLAAMQRAEKNIDSILEELMRRYHRIRQESIDEELFEVVSGFEALNARHRKL